MDASQIGMVTAAMVAFVIFYKRVLHRSGDKPDRMAIIIISVFLLVNVYYVKRPFLAEHGENIMYIVLVMLLILTIMDIYENKDLDETDDKQTFTVTIF
jgi:magnesium-transporting ATPase (P-type)